MDNTRIRALVKAAIRTESIYMSLMRDYLDDYYKPGKSDDKPNPQVVAHMFGMLFKWPDVIIQWMDLIENKPGAEVQITKDLESIIIVPLMTILSSYSEKALLNKADRAEIDKQIVTVNSIADPIERSDKIIELIGKMTSKLQEVK